MRLATTFFAITFLSASSLNAQQAVSFAGSKRLDLPVSTPQNPLTSLPPGPASVLALDLNHDGKQDLVVQGGASEELVLQVYLGNGDGTFQSPASYSTSSGTNLEPGFMVAGDFNADGNPDIAVPCNGDVYIFFGNAAGQLTQIAAAQLGQQPSTIVPANLNKDLATDLVALITDTQNQTVSMVVLLNSGNGTFQSTQLLSRTGVLPAPVVGDLNKDGRPDIVLPTPAGIQIFLGQANGTFQSSTLQVPDPLNPGNPAGYSAVALGDLNHDGNVDIVASLGSSTVTLLGNGSGTATGFQLADATPGAFGCLTLQDFNADGKLDVGGCDFETHPALIETPTSFAILLGNGDGTLQAATDYPMAEGASSGPLPVADFNGDGKPDVALAGVAYSGVSEGHGQIPYQVSFASVLLNNGDGTFPVPPSYYVPNSAGAIQVGDWNGDGKPDLAILPGTDSDYLSPQATSVSILLNRGDGTFSPATSAAAGNLPVAIASADFNADGKGDLAVVNSVDQTISVLISNGDGTFHTQNTISLTIFPGAVLLADFNSDGRPDIAVASTDTILILLNNGDGTFQTGVPVIQPNGTCQANFTCTYVGALLALDFDGDKKPDLVMSSNDSNVLLLHGNGNGTFAAPATIFNNATYQYQAQGAIAAADVDKDGIPDLLLNANSSILVAFGTGGGAVNAPIQLSTGAAPYNFVVSDFNGDGLPDIAVGHGASANIAVLLNAGSRQFQAAQFFGAGPVIASLAGGDFNGDGKPDLVAADAALRDAGYWSGASGIASATSFAVFELLNSSQPPAGLVTQSATSVTTIGSNLSGMTFTVDGTSYAAPQGFIWTPGSQHSIAWNSPQSILYAGYDKQPPVPVTYVFDSWSDGTRQISRTLTAPQSDALFTGSFVLGTPSLGVMLTPAPGEPLPSTSPTFTWSAASNATQYLLEAGSSPGGHDLFSQTTSSTSLSVPNLPAGNNPIYVTLSSQVSGTYIPQSYVYFGVVTGSVTIETSPSGLEFSIDGGALETAPQTVSLPGGTHTIAVAATQAGSPGIQYVFDNWSDGGAASHTVTVTGASSTFTANFTTQYQLTISASPAADGTVTPASGGFYAAGIAVPVAATANSGFAFASWAGTVASSSSSSTTVTMSAPQTLVANFSPAGSAHPAFFGGEDFLGGSIYYLQFSDGNLFGYYGYLSSSILYHLDMGYEAFIPSTGSQIYFYDFASGHWWYTSSSLFPYIYDFTLNTFIYYLPDTKNPGHYTTNPRYFSNLTAGTIFTM